jgi:hypothetical protein
MNHREIYEALDAIIPLLPEQDRPKGEYARNLLIQEHLAEKRAELKLAHQRAKAEYDRQGRILSWVNANKCLCESLDELFKSSDADGLEKMNTCTRKLRQSRHQLFFILSLMP